MNILLIHQYFCLGTEPGHPRFHELAMELAKKHSVHVITGEINYLTNKRRTLPECVGNIKITTIPTTGSHHGGITEKEKTFYSFLEGAIRKGLGENVDLVIASSPPLHAALAGYIVCRAKKARFILEIRDLWPEILEELGLLKSPAKAWLAKKIAAHLYTKAEKIIVLSEGFSGFIKQKYGVEGEKIEFIPNWARPEKTAKKNGTKTRVGIIGAMGHQYDIENLAKTMMLLESNRKIEFHINGDGTQKQALEEKIKKLALSNTKIIPVSPRHELWKTMKEIDIGFVPLKSTPLLGKIRPRRVVDFLSYGIPIIIAGKSFEKEFLLYHCGINIPAGDPVAWKNAIEELAERKKKREKMGVAGKKYVEEKLSRKKMLQTYCRLVAPME